MAKFVRRDRKKRRRTVDKSRNGGVLDTNVSEVVPTAPSEKEKKKREITDSIRAQQPAMSSKKAKRLDKYIDTKLRKEDTLGLIKQLEVKGINTSQLKRNGLSKPGIFGQSSQKKRKRPVDGERKHGPSAENEGSSTEDSDVSDSSQDEDFYLRQDKAQGQSVVPARPVVGSGLKRSLDAPDGNPVIPKRQRLHQLSREPNEGDDSPWEGFSTDSGSDASVGSQSSSSCSRSTQTDSDDESTYSETSSSSAEFGHHSGAVNEALNARRKQRSSAFKAWASQQVNEALGFTPSGPSALPQTDHLATEKYDIKPREPEEEPLPPELQPTNTVPDRTAFSVAVNRTEDMQRSRLELPIVAEEQKIMEAIYNNPTVVIWGATGSGKTTQVPQFLFEAGFGDPRSPNPGMIGITQPRRVAAVSMAKRVSDELGNLTSKVSYQIRFESSVGDKTAIKFMTDGILIREIASDFALLKYSVIVIDEAHVRSTNTDILIGMVSRIGDLRASMSRDNPKVKPLKLVIMSATLRISDFLQNPNLFRNGSPPLLQAEGRQYPVTEHFARRTQRDYLEETFRKVSKGHKKLPPGGMLVFLTGQGEIMSLAKRLREAFVHSSGSRDQGGKVRIGANEAPQETEDLDIGEYDYEGDRIQDGNSDSEDTEDDDQDFVIEESTAASSQIHVLPLYSQLQTKDQLRVFEPPPEGSRFIVLATNVAETSLTIPGIRYVFDCGRAKEKKYDQLTGVQSFEIGWISKASASQRAGRAGRTGPGHCYRLYSSAVYERDFKEHAEPEILRMPVEDVVLQLKSMDLQHVVNFPFPTPPDRSSLFKAEKLLTYLGALSNGKITPVGRDLSIYPLSPRFSKMLSIGHQHSCMPYTIAMVAALAVPELFIPENQLDLSTPIQDTQSIYTHNDLQADEAREARRKSYNHAHHLFSRNSMTSDGLKALTALCAYAYAPNPTVFCTEMFLRPKAFLEASRLRSQLSYVVQTNHPTLLGSYTSCLPEPSKTQLKALQQIVAAAFIDQVAIRADLAPSPPEMLRKPSRAIDQPYLPLFPVHQGRVEDLIDIAVFIHHSSVLAHLPPKELPQYLVYSHLQRGTPATIVGSKKTKTRMHALTNVTEKQIQALAKGTPLLEYGKPIGKILEVETGVRECWVGVEMRGEKGKEGWPLGAKRVVQRRKGGEWVVEKFHGATQWHFDQNQEAQLAARACFVAAHGEQQELVDCDSSSGYAEEATKSDLDDDDDILIVESGFPRLKERFLDRLAELFTREQEASFVTATSMDEYEDKVVLYIFRNEQFSRKDSDFQRQMTLCLETCNAKGSIDRKHSLDFWHQMLRYYKCRLITHLSALCNYLNRRGPTASNPYTMDTKQYTNADLACILCQCRSLGKGASIPDAELGGLIELSYSVSRSSTASTETSSSALGEVHSDQKLFTLIRFVARVKTIYLTLMNTAVHFPSFQHQEVVVVPGLHTAHRLPARLKIPFSDLTEAVEGSARAPAIKQLGKVRANMRARQGTAARLAYNAKAREDHAEALTWETLDAEGCRHRQLTPADVLLLSCIEDKYPNDEEVQSDFHIHSFGEPEDRISAFLLYKEMLLDLRLSAWRLNKWVTGDCLREGIIQFHTRQQTSTLVGWQAEEALLEKILDAYFHSLESLGHDVTDRFSWFLENLERFGPNFARNVYIEETGQKIKDWAAQHRPLFLGPLDNDVSISESMRESAEKASQFWLETEFQIPQFPGEPGWIDFGFCVRQSDKEQAALMLLYRKLLRRCSFDEFTDAMRQTSLTELFDQHGLQSETKRFRHFRSVLSNIRTLPSVWYLKSFVLAMNQICQKNYELFLSTTASNTVGPRKIGQG
ncbi:MAG: hypothetical protein Q9221_007614 [Calogaya cf. arnoldii]